MNSIFKRIVLCEKKHKIDLSKKYIKIPPLPKNTMITTMYYVMCGEKRFFDGSELNEIVQSYGGWVTLGGSKKFHSKKNHPDLKGKTFIPFDYEDRSITDNPNLIEKELLESIIINGINE